MSAVEICNLALSTYLGLGTITSLTEGTPEADQCNLHYEPTRKTLLEMHWWNFAKSRATLVEDTNDREEEWEYKYTLPIDILSVRWVNEVETARGLMAQDKSPDTDREILMADGVVYSDVYDASIEYTADVSDTDDMPQYFQNAMAAALAAAMAIPLTEDTRKAQNAQRQALTNLDNAVVLDERNTAEREYRTVPECLEVRGIS